MVQTFKKIKNVSGELSLPGDKSISHRALFISALAEGESAIKNLSQSDDVKSTIKCLESLGVEIHSWDKYTAVGGKGIKGFKKPKEKLNASNSGTTARLLSGILAMQDFESTIIGDDSLSNRPMKRIIEPLTLMGADIKSSTSLTLPLTFHPSSKIKSIKYNLPVPSAQAKSAILFAGLHCEGITKVTEHSVTRDHTERILGLKINKADNKISSSVSKTDYPDPKEFFIPGDISTASFFIVLTLLSKNSKLVLKDISLNPTRLGFVELLIRMGADISYKITHVSSNELFGKMAIKSSELKNIPIEKNIITQIIDEIPILSVAGLFAEGDFELRNAKELRFKESDRINSLLKNYSMLGLGIEEYSDGFNISGQIKNFNPVFNSYGDHRIAMAVGILSSLMEDGGTVDGFECVSVSNPDFLIQLNSITG